MLSLGLAIGILLALAVIFMAWPLWRYRHTTTANSAANEIDINFRLVENVRLFREHLAELENNVATQRIGAEQFAQLKVELERNLLDDETSLRAINKTLSVWIGVKTAALFSVFILIAGVFLYQHFGSAEDVAVQTLQQEKMQQDYQDMLQNRDPDPARAQALIVEYKARIKDKPESVQYWFLLARTQMEIANFGDAAQSYQQVLQRDPQSSMIMAELAQAMFLRDGNKTSPPIADLAKSALLQDPKNTMALGLAGIDAFNNKNYRDAVRYWQRTLDIVGETSAHGQSLLGGINRAKEQFIVAGGKLEDLTAKSAYAVQLWVSLGDKVKAAPDQIVFVYARGWKSTPMPLAIVRIKVSELPKLITLDETMAMSPMATLANTPEIEVVARISIDGTAQTKVGDWLAKQGPVSMKNIPEKIELRINERVDTVEAKPQ